MSILDKWLEKSGFKSSDELRTERINGLPSERETYEQYRKLLVGSTVTIESLKAFCESQIAIIETKVANGIDRPTDIQLASLHVYLNIKKAIDAPEAERAALEQHLTEIINN